MEFLTTFINGLSQGGVYAMIAIGYTMVYGIAKMLNFAHGDIIMVGGYTILVFMNMNFNPLIAALVAVLFCVGLGVAIEKVAYKPLRGASPLAVLITAIGISKFLQSIAQITMGSNGKQVIVGDFGVMNIGGLAIETKRVITLVCTIAIMIALSLFIKYSKTGRAMIATSEDRAATQLMGISVNKIITITFAIGSALAAVASLFSLMESPSINSTYGSMPGIKAFTAAVIGGIGSIPGAMLGGVLLGLIESFAAKVPEVAPFTAAIEFGILIVILLVKPSGILGKKRREKV